MQTEKTHEDWERGKAHELRFWNEIFPEDNNFTHDFYKNAGSIYQLRAQTQKRMPMPDISRLIEGIDKDPVVTLEVGSGPLPKLGILETSKNLAILTLDPLMDDYIELLKQRHIDLAALFPEGKFVTGMAEDASRLFDLNSIDFIYSSNALDHCEDPAKCINELYKICAGGGCLYLTGMTNEGEYQKYSGFHQWNLDVQGGNLVIWRPNQKILQNELDVPKSSIHSYIETKKGRDHWCVVIQKT